MADNSPTRPNGTHRAARGGERLPDSGDRHDSAVQRLADQVVLRLADRLHPGDTAAPPESLTVGAFVAALIDGDDTLSLAMVRAATTDRKGVYFGILAPAAQWLGDMWQNDEISFLELSIAAGRIFSILRQLRRDNAGQTPEARPRALAMFASVPDEEHTMGVTMAADLFRERGWQVDLRCGVTQEILVAEAAATPFAVIGLSAGHPSSAPALIRLVTALRQTAPATRIILSGQILHLMPGVAALCDTDLATSDFDTLLAAAESYLDA